MLKVNPDLGNYVSTGALQGGRLCHSLSTLNFPRLGNLGSRLRLGAAVRIRRVNVGARRYLPLRVRWASRLL
jgi:hypothetical protein